MQVRAVNVSLTAGEGPNGDLDELVDGEHRVLRQGAVRAGDMGLVEGGVDLAGRSRRPDRRQRRPATTK